MEQLINCHANLLAGQFLNGNEQPKGRKGKERKETAFNQQQVL
jgi:hypothetical protein